MTKKEDGDGKEQSKADLIPYDTDDRYGPAWLGLGLLSFGFVTGGIAGLSLFPGTSQTLLTSIFTFVGGVVLTFGGFVRAEKKSPKGLVLRISRVGAGLVCFSLGLALGVLGGISLRVHMAETRSPAGVSGQKDARDEKKDSKEESTPAKNNNAPGPSDYGLQNAHRNECIRILSLSEADYVGADGPELAKRDLEFVREYCKCSP